MKCFWHTKQTPFPHQNIEMTMSRDSNQTISNKRRPHIFRPLFASGWVSTTEAAHCEEISDQTVVPKDKMTRVETEATWHSTHFASHERVPRRVDGQMSGSSEDIVTSLDVVCMIFRYTCRTGLSLAGFTSQENERQDWRSGMLVQACIVYQK